MTRATLTEQIEAVDWSVGGQELMRQLVNNAKAGSEVGLAAVVGAAVLIAREFPGQSFAETAALHARLDEFGDLVFAIRNELPVSVLVPPKLQVVGGADAG